MANHPSADKRNRQRLVRTQRNRAVRSALRSALKEARLAIQANGAESEVTVQKVAAAKKALARAASKGVIHMNNAARKTSRMDHALTKQA